MFIAVVDSTRYGWEGDEVSNRKPKSIKSKTANTKSVLYPVYWWATYTIYIWWRGDTVCGLDNMLISAFKSSKISITSIGCYSSLFHWPAQLFFHWQSQSKSCWLLRHCWVKHCTPSFVYRCVCFVPDLPLFFATVWTHLPPSATPFKYLSNNIRITK